MGDRLYTSLDRELGKWPWYRGTPITKGVRVTVTMYVGLCTLVFVARTQPIHLCCYGAVLLLYCCCCCWCVSGEAAKGTAEAVGAKASSAAAAMKEGLTEARQHLQGATNTASDKARTWFDAVQVCTWLHFPASASLSRWCILNQVVAC